METAEIVNELDRLSKEEIEPVIEDAFDFAINRLNCFPGHMIMKREGIAEYCVFSSKKKYAMMLWDKEGTRYEKLKFKTKGMQMVQSSTPNILKEKLIKSVEYIMMSEDPMVLKNYLDETKKWFMTLTPDEIAFPRSANNIAKYSDSNNIYGKKCPIAVRGCLIHNHYIKQNNVDWKIIKEGEKIKFIYMNRPNPYYNSNIFSFPGKFKASHDYVDYNTQWQKSFYKTVIKLAKECGIDIESYKTISLDDIF
jgi:hypothetical protein